MSKRPPRIVAEITLLRSDEGGRKTAPSFNVGQYMSPTVVQGPAVREAQIGPNRIALDLYEGVRCVGGPSDYRLGEVARVDLELMYYPDHRYENVVPGSTFTIREGHAI